MAKVLVAEPLAQAGIDLLAAKHEVDARSATTPEELLVAAGYQPESAYFETFHELKLIVDLLYEGGMEYMRYSVSDTAEYGDYTRGPRIIDASVKARMRKVLDEVQSGEFAREWILENQAGRPHFNALRRQNAEHPVEQVGKEVRAMMSWLNQGGRR